MKIQFTIPKIIVATHEGRQYLIAAQSFIDQFPEMINHVFLCTDKEFKSPYFDKYCEDRIKAFKSIKGGEGLESNTDIVIELYRPEQPQQVSANEVEDKLNP